MDAIFFFYSESCFDDKRPVLDVKILALVETVFN